MRKWSRTRVLLFAGALAFQVGCEEDLGPIAPPGTVPTPVVRASLGFGDAPLEGELILDPGTPISTRDAWRYEVDLDADGEPDATGTVDQVVTIAYRFQELGPHRLMIALERGEEEAFFERFVVVNDPTGIDVLGPGVIPGEVDILEGITHDRLRDVLYVSDPSVAELFELDSEDLSIRRFVDLSSALNGKMEGLAIAPDEDLLYVVDKSYSLQVLSLPGLERLENFSLGFGNFFVHALPGRRAYVGGETGIALIDTREGRVIESFRMMTGLGHFAVHPDGATIALLGSAAGTQHSITFLTADGLVTQRTVIPDIGEAFLAAAAFSPDGDQLYVLVDRDPFRLLVVSFPEGTILQEIVLSGVDCPGCTAGLTAGYANPVATTADGRFVVFPTAIGTFFVDTTVDLPLYRSPDPDPWQALFCCNVAAHPTDPRIVYVADFNHKVLKLEIRR